MELQAKTEVEERATQFRQHHKPSHGQFNLVLSGLMEAAQLQVSSVETSHDPIQGRSESAELEEQSEDATEVEERETDDADAVSISTPQQLVQVTQTVEVVVATSTKTPNIEELGKADMPEVLQNKVSEDTMQLEPAEQMADSAPATDELPIVPSERPVAIDIESTPEESSGPVTVKSVEKDESTALANRLIRETKLAGNTGAVTENTPDDAPKAVSAEGVESGTPENKQPAKGKSSTISNSNLATAAPVLETGSADVARQVERDSPEKTVVKGTEEAEVSSSTPPLPAQESQLGSLVPISALAGAAATISSPTANQPPQLSVQGSQAIAKAQASDQSAPIKEVSATEESKIETKRGKATPKLKSARNVNSRQIEIIRQVAKSIALRGASRSTDVRLALSPPNLGTVRLKISMNDGVLSGSIVTESQSIRHLLQQQVPELREALAQDGIQLGDLDVSTEEQQQPSSQQHQESARQQPTRAVAQITGSESQVETKPEIATVNDGRVQGYM